MSEPVVSRPPVPWLAGGLLLGAVQVLAVALAQPLGVSTQFVTVNAKVLETVAPGYVEDHTLVGKPSARRFGYPFWLVVGIPVGAAAAALATRRRRRIDVPAFWEVNHGPSRARRFLTTFLAGIVILLGARLAHGCTSGQMASGWAQLALAALPFTIGLFGAGMAVAFIAFRRAPRIEN
jgi:hypothetical protein